MILLLLLVNDAYDVGLFFFAFAVRLVVGHTPARSTREAPPAERLRCQAQTWLRMSPPPRYLFYDQC